MLETEVMEPSIYARLPPENFSIRLLRLLPSADSTSPIRCTLVVYPLSVRQSGAHLYEALSYVWGPSDNPQPIFIDSDGEFLQVSITRNLHAALSQLRDAVFERVLWVDALCINQQDGSEKAHQVGAMARIYGLAQRVVVWLGDDADDSARVLKEIGEMALRNEETIFDIAPERKAEPEHEDYDEEIEQVDGDDQQKEVVELCELGLLALLDRPYFRRIWILQELAAARSILVKCGDSEIQGTTFLTGLSALDLSVHKTETSLQNRIHAIISLLRSSSARESLKGHPHLDIQPLTELVDMFQAHDATDRRDKIYALLGLCSDHALATRLQPDYSKEWKVVFEELGRFVFGPESVVTACPTQELMFVQVRGFILGSISEISSKDFWNDTQTMRITSMSPFRYLNDSNDWIIACNLRKSARKLRKCDIALLTDNSRKLIIVRPAGYYFKIIMITDSRLARLELGKESNTWISWQPYLENVQNFPVILPLVWNWHEGQESEERDALSLMRSLMRDIPNPDQIFHDSELKRAALSDVPVLVTSFQERSLGSGSLNDALRAGSRICHEDKPITIKGFESSADEQHENSSWKRVKILLHEWCFEVTSKIRRILAENEETAWTGDEVAWSCCATVIGLTGWAYPTTNRGGYPGPGPNWMGYAVEGIMTSFKEDILINAAKLAIKSPSFAKPNGEMRLPNSSFDWLIETQKSKLFDRTFLKLVRLADGRVNNLVEVIESIAANSDIDLAAILVLMLETLGDQFDFTSDVIEAAIANPRLSAEALSALLKVTAADVVLSEATFRAVAANTGKEAGGLMKIMMEHAGSDYASSEEVLIQAAGNKQQGAEILLEILESSTVPVNITVPILTAAVKCGVRDGNQGVFALLRFRRNVQVTSAVINAIVRELDNAENGSYRILLDLKTNKPISQRDVETAAANGRIGYINLLTLIRERDGEFKITAKVIKAALKGPRVREAPQIVPLLLHSAKELYDDEYPEGLGQVQGILPTKKEMIALFMKYKGDCDIDQIIKTTDILDYMAVEGDTYALRLLCKRCAIDDHKTYRFVAHLSQAIEAEDDDTVLRRIGRINPSPTSQRLCNHLLMRAIHHRRGKVVYEIFRAGLAIPNFQDSYLRTPLHLATSRGLQTEIVTTILRYGGDKSLDLEDAKGRTPRRTINGLVSEEQRSCDTWHHLLVGLEGAANLGVIAGADMPLVRLADQGSGADAKRRRIEDANSQLDSKRAKSALVLDR